MVLATLGHGGAGGTHHAGGHNHLVDHQGHQTLAQNCLLSGASGAVRASLDQPFRYPRPSVALIVGWCRAPFGRVASLFRSSNDTNSSTLSQASSGVSTNAPSKTNGVSAENKTTKINPSSEPSNGTPINQSTTPKNERLWADLLGAVGWIGGGIILGGLAVGGLSMLFFTAAAPFTLGAAVASFMASVSVSSLLIGSGMKVTGHIFNLMNENRNQNEKGDPRVAKIIGGMALWGVGIVLFTAAGWGGAFAACGALGFIVPLVPIFPIILATIAMFGLNMGANSVSLLCSEIGSLFDDRVQTDPPSSSVDANPTSSSSDTNVQTDPIPPSSDANVQIDPAPPSYSAATSPHVHKPYETMRRRNTFAGEILLTDRVTPEGSV